MVTLEALQDRFRRTVVFEMTVVVPGVEGLGRVLTAVADRGAAAGEVRFVEVHHDVLVYSVQVFAVDDAQMVAVRADVEALAGVTVRAVLDMAMETHRGGACEMRSRVPIRSNTDLRIVYTPGVARVCRAIEADPSKARQYTNLANKVAIVTNGTAILGLGDIGPVAGLPVMEGKAAIFWEFARISAEPILIDTHDPKEFIAVCERIAPTFGAIQIEDVKAPECFEITRTLDERLGIPVFHDDQHGTATIVLAGVHSAVRMTGKRIEDLACVISGAGAAGTAITDLLTRAGVPDVVLCDSAGALYPGRSENMNPEKAALAGRTNRDDVRGTLADAMKGRELFIGVSRPNLVSREMVRSMAPGPIVFALSNPVSEIDVAEAYEAGASVAADGRMMNNALAYPGIFRGALDAAAESITIDMMMAAAEALARIVPDGAFLPEMMDPATHEAVAEAVKGAVRPG
ncbi:MAG TPA: malic enzyme-like NAD(P)-binding protein [Phycisphaerae bacterium]|nr:malic enzyme-like NAD(P)-binding protein [Phycisphaerae bacterium]